MNRNVKPNDPLIQCILALAPTRRERAAKLGWTVQHTGRVERGVHTLDQVRHLITAGVLTIVKQQEVEEAHEGTNEAQQ